MSRKMDDALGRIKKLQKHVQETDGKITKKLLKEADKDVDNLASMRKAEYDTQTGNTNVGSPEAIMKSVYKNDCVQKEFQTKCDDILLVSKVLKRPVTSLKMYDNFKRSDLAKAMDTSTATEGFEWVPTDFSSQVSDLVALPTNIEALFGTVDMPTNPYKPTLVTTRPVMYIASEATADSETATKYTSTKVGTGNLTMDAVKLVIRIDFSDEVDEDSIVPMLPTLRTQMQKGGQEHRESAIVDGDTAGTHQDSDVTDSADVRKAWEGLRQLAQTSTDLATFTYDNYLALLAGMGRYFDPVNNAAVTSTAGMIKFFNLKDSSGNQVTATVDKYGANAPVLTGEVGRVGGVPIVRSQWVRSDLNAAGNYDATTTDKTIVLVVHRPSIAMGHRKGVTLEMDREIRTGQDILVLYQRLILSRMVAAADTFVAKGYGISST